MNWANFKPASVEIRKSKMVTPEMLAATNSETGHQRAIFCWSALTENRQRWPDLVWMFAVPNGGFRPKPIAAAMKAEGVKTGVPDIWLPVRRGVWPTLIIELKRPPTPGKRVGKTSPEQDGYIAHLRAQGFAVAVCVGWLQARDTLVSYLEWKE